MRLVILLSTILFIADAYMKAVKHSSVYDASRSSLFHLKANLDEDRHLLCSCSKLSSWNHITNNLLSTINKGGINPTNTDRRGTVFKNIFRVASCTLLIHILNQLSPIGIQPADAVDDVTAVVTIPIISSSRLATDSLDTPKIDNNDASSRIDFGQLKVPYEHVNFEFKQFVGKKATIVFNMKIDDPQTILQFPDIMEIYKRYKSQGLNVMAFPTEQGWFEPDDDETCRAKAKEFYGFGDYPHAVVFDKVDILGPSATPFYSALTKQLSTPNGYGRITLNYEKFLLDSEGNPVRRYPRKYSAYDMEADIVALINDQPLPQESAQYQKAWREAKREAIKSEYAFRYNYNYYTAPDSMYKYNPNNDSK